MTSTAPSPNRQKEMEPIGEVALLDCWNLRAARSGTGGVAPNVTTGAKKTNPPRTSAKQTNADMRVAFRRMILVDAGAEHAAQSPHRHPGRQTAHEQLADSSWKILMVHASPRVSPTPTAATDLPIFLDPHPRFETEQESAAQRMAPVNVALAQRRGSRRGSFPQRGSRR